ncbi:MAG: gamma-glutamyl-gamma-aminobutyrate hydrolase family protein [Chitinophagaceae bacterium]|nr:MAG: gamma-glutamyl-gamma-aminobutyrate hydrolase family protein [Chitinophagaceae bacterium]
MRKIGVTFTGMDENKLEEKQLNYLRWLEGAGSGMEIVTLYPSAGLPELDGFAGILFSGGVDIQPSLYGMQEGYPNAPELFNKTRDVFEKQLFEKTQQLGLPVLGVCRGMQLINALSGGTLTQDLGIAGNQTHRAIPGDKQHWANVEEGSQLSAIVRSSRISINSAHHQSVGQVAPGFRIGAFSQDGEPESLERISPEGLSFLLAVQWHPERMFRFGLQDEPASAGIRDQFINASKKYSENN